MFEYFIPMNFYIPVAAKPGQAAGKHSIFHTVNCTSQSIALRASLNGSLARRELQTDDIDQALANNYSPNTSHLINLS